MATTSALFNNAHTLKYIQNPSFEAQVLAIDVDNSAVQYIKNPAPMIEYNALERRPRRAVEYLNFSPEKLHM